MAFGMYCLRSGRFEKRMKKEEVVFSGKEVGEKISLSAVLDVKLSIFQYVFPDELNVGLVKLKMQTLHFTVSPR